MKQFQAKTIEDVIAIMDNIIRNNRLRGSRVAYFTVLYRTTTYMVKKYCDEGGFFENDDRMRHLDVVFANFYFDAFFADQHYNETPPSQSWKVTFEAADNPEIVLLQHLLVGMNAHISLDLGIATAIVANGDLNDSLKRDFMRLNDILASLIEVVQAEVATVSPVLGAISQVTMQLEHHFLNQGIRMARNRAWDFAEKLNTSPREAWESLIAEHDKAVANISRNILSPAWYLQPALNLIRQQEQDSPHDIISGLAGEQWFSQAHKKVMAVIGNIHDPNIELMKRETHLMRAIKTDTDTLPRVP